VLGQLRDPITRKLVGAKCKFVAFWWNRALVLQDMYNTKCASPFFVKLLGIKLKISVPKKLPITASFLQNSCDTELYTFHLGMAVLGFELWLPCYSVTPQDWNLLQHCYENLSS
jgi:hypothetical protein